MALGNYISIGHNFFRYRAMAAGYDCFFVGSLPVLAAIWYYRYWTTKDPNRLQTEDFRIQLQAIAKISSSDGREIIIDQTAALLENPMLESDAMLEKGQGK